MAMVSNRFLVSLVFSSLVLSLVFTAAHKDGDKEECRRLICKNECPQNDIECKHPYCTGNMTCQTHSTSSESSSEEDTGRKQCHFSDDCNMNTECDEKEYWNKSSFCNTEQRIPTAPASTVPATTASTNSDILDEDSYQEGGRKVGHGGKKVEDNEVAVIATIVPLATTALLLIVFGAIFLVTRLRGKPDTQANPTKTITNLNSMRAPRSEKEHSYVTLNTIKIENDYDPLLQFNTNYVASRDVYGNGDKFSEPPPLVSVSPARRPPIAHVHQSTGQECSMPGTSQNTPDDTPRPSLSYIPVYAKVNKEKRY